MDGNNVGSFWDVDQYRRVIKRIENGYRSCDNFLSMVQERAEIEQRYAKSIKKWNEKWSGVVEKGMEYGSSLDAWRSCIQEGTVVAQLHEECKLKIMGEHGPFYNMYKWKKEHYHKGAFGSLQEAREANDGFAAAQKEYSRLLSKTESAKKTYHAACISAHKAHLFAQDETRDESVRPEFRRKLQQRAAKLASQQEKLKQRYLKRVMKCNGSAKDHYVQDMTGELTKWQSLERVRLDTLHAQLILFVKAVDCGAKYSLEDLYRRLEETISQADSVRDVHEWDAQHGTGCPKHWPRFEEMDVNELDAAAYADVERKTSFGNALLHRRRQRSKHRRSHHNTYSSMTDIDEEDFFSSDSFDSTSTESEDVHRDNQSLTRNSAHVHHSRHQANIPETHQQSPRQHYGHRVTNLSTNYDEQLDSQSQSLSHRTRPTNHLRHQHERTSRHDADLQTQRSDHRKLGERHRHSHYIPSNTAKQHQRVNKHNISNQSPRPYHATQWPSNHAWHPVTYEANHHSGSTPPTRDVDVPAQIPLAQQHTSVVGNHPHSEQLLTPSSSNQRTVGTPIQSYHQVNVPKYAGQALTTYGTPYNVQTTQEKVPASTTTNYQATYQGTPNTGHPTTNTSTNYYQGATTTASTPANYQGETATAITPTSYQRTYQGETATASTPTNYQGTYQGETATGHATTTNIPTNYHGTPGTGHATVNTPTNYQGDYQRTTTSEHATTNTPTNYGTPSTGPSNTQQTATATPTNYQGATTGHSTSGTQQATNNAPSSTLSWWHLHNQQQAWQQTTPRGSEIRSDGQTTSARHERHTTVDRAKQLLHLEDNEFMVRALYDFKAGTRDEIPLKKGEVLVQTGKHLENGWASGRNLEKAGIFPASYVQVVR